MAEQEAKGEWRGEGSKGEGRGVVGDQGSEVTAMAEGQRAAGVGSFAPDGKQVLRVANDDKAERRSGSSSVEQAQAQTDAEGTEGWIGELRGLMWRDAGLLRDGLGLRRAQARLEAMRETMPQGLSRREVEARNLHTVAEVMVASALGREESRGAHFRSDFPGREAVGRHSVMQSGRLRFDED